MSDQLQGIMNTSMEKIRDLVDVDSIIAHPLPARRDRYHSHFECLSVLCPAVRICLRKSQKMCLPAVRAQALP